MTRFSNFTRENLDNLRADLEKVLSHYGVDANLEFNLGKIKFSNTEAEIILKTKVKGEENVLSRKARQLGIQLKNANGDELVDYSTRSYKMPFVFRSSADGKNYKCTVEHAKLLFA